VFLAAAGEIPKRRYTTIMYPVLTYGSETWILNKKEEKTINNI
jgi:hypothetical protein